MVSRSRAPARSGVALLRGLLFSTTILGAAAGQAAETDRPQIEEITVTALKRETFLDATPIAITALPGKLLEELGAFEFNDYFRRVPGLAVLDSGYGHKRYLIRGVSTIETGVSQATVAQYLDEVPITDNFDAQPDPRLVDVDRVEVLRGPQGTLFGARSMAGTIRTITRKPRFDAIEANGTATVSRTRFGGTNANVEGAVNVPAGDTFAVRGVGFYSYDDGTIDNEYPGGHYVITPAQLPPGTPVPAPTTVAPINDPNFSSVLVYGGRLAARWQPSDRVTLDVMGLAQNATVKGVPFYNVAQSGDESRGLKTSFYGTNGNADHLRIAAATLNYDATIADVTATGSYAGRDNTANGGSPLQGPLSAAPLGGTMAAGGDTRAWTGEVRAASKGDGPLQWLVGGYIFSQSRDSRVRNLLGFGQVNVGDFTNASQSDERAAFGELSYKPLEGLTATAGLRYSNYKNSLVRFYFVPPPGQNIPPGPDRNPLHYKDDNTTWKFQVSYQANPDLLTYVLASQGFRPGGFNPNSVPGFNVVPPTFTSDSLWNYEVGAKTRWLSNRLEINGDIYRIDWSRMQVQGFAPPPFGPGFIAYASNAAASQIVGAELEATAVISEHFSADFSFNHFFKDALSKDAPVNPNGLAPKAGDPLSYNPVTSFNAGGEYRTPVFAGLDGNIRIDWSYVGPRFTGFRPFLQNGQTNTIYNHLPSYSLVDLRVGVSKGQWRAMLFAQNLFDERAVLQQQNASPPATDIGRVTARPRTVGLTVSARY